MGAPLNLPLPNGTAAADVRLALLAKRLITYPEAQVREDAARILNMATRGLPSDIDCERAALCLAGIEWAVRREGEHGYRANAFNDDVITNSPQTPQEEEQRDVDATPRKKRGRPSKISDELKLRALAAHGAKTRAQILYGCQYPTNQQKKNVSAILKHFLSKSTPD
jgi:hypothetical protein